MKISSKKNLSDYLGIASSALCVVHCIATPVWFSAHAAMSAMNHHHHFMHDELDYIFIAFSFVAVIISSNNTRLKTIKILFWAFLGIFILFQLMKSMVPALEYFSYLASAGLIITHLYNIRFFREMSCKVQH